MIVIRHNTFRTVYLLSNNTLTVNPLSRTSTFRTVYLLSNNTFLFPSNSKAITFRTVYLLSNNPKTFAVIDMSLTRTPTFNTTQHVYLSVLQRFNITFLFFLSPPFINLHKKDRTATTLTIRSLFRLPNYFVMSNAS